MDEAPKQPTALRIGRLYPQEIPTYVRGWPLPVEASTDTLYLVISNRPWGYIGPFTCDEMTFTWTYIITFIFCSEPPLLQVQYRFCLYFTKSTFMARLLAIERTTSFLHSALDASLSALFGPAIRSTVCNKPRKVVVPAGRTAI